MSRYEFKFRCRIGTPQNKKVSWLFHHYKKMTLAHDSEDSCPGDAVESAVVQRMLVQSHASSQSVFVQNSENESFLNVALFFI